jgi:hypothetical protein
MSETYGTTGMGQDDATRELGTVETAGSTGASYSGGPVGTSGGPSSTQGVAKDEARATGQQAKEGARHVAEVGKDEAKNVAQETGQQAKELWQQTRTQLMDQSAEQQTRVAEGLRSLGQELSGMAEGSEQQGVASDLARQASQRMEDVAGWLDQRDPGSLVTELKQFARQRPGAFLATAAVVGLVGGRLSRGLVADHKEHSGSQGGTAVSSGAPLTDHSTSGYSAYGSPSGAAVPVADNPVSDPHTSPLADPAAGPVAGPVGIPGGNAPDSGLGAGEYPR